MLNKTDLAAPLGMSVPGITSWLSILEATHQVLIVPPYFENLGKRLIKSPRVYIADSGLACHLLGIETEAELKKSPLLGEIFEGFIASEILKAQLNAGRRREIYYFRDQQGLEVDFVLPRKGRRPAPGRGQGYPDPDARDGRADAPVGGSVEGLDDSEGTRGDAPGPPALAVGHG